MTTDIIKKEAPKVLSLERLVELAEQKKAVKFGGVIKPAAVVLHMQGSLIASMIKRGVLFEYYKTEKVKQSPRFYKSGKPRKPLYSELERKNKSITIAIEEFLSCVRNTPKTEDGVLQYVDSSALEEFSKAFNLFKEEQ